MDTAMGLQWFALCFIFLAGTIWSEDNVRFGYIFTPLVATFFWWLGWIQFAYLSTVLPALVFIGVISYLRAHLRYKFGVFGSNSSLIWKIMSFLIIMQLAILFINGMAIFNTNFAPTPQNEFTGTYNNQTGKYEGGYTLERAEDVYGGKIGEGTSTDTAAMILTLGWSMLAVVWSMLMAVVMLYPQMVTQFGVHPTIAAAISMGFYIMLALELFILLFKPVKPPEV